MIVLQVPITDVKIVEVVYKYPYTKSGTLFMPRLRNLSKYGRLASK